MKKIVVFIIVFLLLGRFSTKSVKLNHDEIMRGDLSSISGEYVNSKGKIINLEDDISDRLRDDVMYHEGTYYMNVSTDDGLFGVGLTIYPAGVEVLGWDFDEGYVVIKTDTSKIRLCYGHDLPTSAEEIFEKK